MQKQEQEKRRFGIPLIQKLNENKESSAIILTPTRELAIQVDKHIKDLMGKI